MPGALLTVKAVDTLHSANAISDEYGHYSLQNLPAGKYQLTVTAPEFKEFIQRGITLLVNQAAQLNVRLELGAMAQTTEVNADVSPINFETATLKRSINPDVISELPLLMSGNIRSAASFVTLLPGVNTGSGSNPADARINGGLLNGDEVILDGVSMGEGLDGDTGMVASHADFTWSPDAISEVSLLASNYEPQYGNTTGGVVIAETKSGTKDWHGSAYEFIRNTVLNARQFGIPRELRPKDIESDFGGSIGGPVKIPWIFSAPHRTSYFFFNYEQYLGRGNIMTQVVSIPSMKERHGDFTDWLNPDGNLIPVYDPATTRPNPSFNPELPAGPENLEFLRNQFKGCDGKTLNVICPDRIRNSLAFKWFKFLPTPTFSGPLNNYVVPTPPSELGDRRTMDVRFDQYWGDKDRFSLTVHYRGWISPKYTTLPPPIAFESYLEESKGNADRLNWTHTFDPNRINQFAFSYLEQKYVSSPISKPYANELPVIPGTLSNEDPPVIRFEGWEFLGFNSNGWYRSTRPIYIANNLTTWISGKNIWKFGGEIRRSGMNDYGTGNTSGTFNFARRSTGLKEDLLSGNSIASFLLEEVDSASMDLLSQKDYYPRASEYNLHFGNIQRLMPKLTLSYGLRWDLSKPSVEKYDRLSFIDPNGPNPGAGNRPGRLAFAGDQWGSASYGKRYPEILYKRAFAPRLGLAYAFNSEVVLRAGYGIFFGQASYPGWSGGMGNLGFNNVFALSSSNNSYTPAMVLNEGFPPIPPDQIPPFLDPAFANGAGGGGVYGLDNYRPIDGNRLPYTQQWNLTLEKQFGKNLNLSAAYIGNKGTRLPSVLAPLNALHPKYLSMGSQLEDVFQSGDTELHGVPIPYPGWVEQMLERNCLPEVGQALMPFPQFCTPLFGLNENAGNSTYHSFQLKIEKRFSQGFYLLGSYTNAKTLTSSDAIQSWGATFTTLPFFSPWERHRAKGLALNDVPQILVVSLIYNLPFGPGKKFSSGNKVISRLAEGWQFSSILRATSGTPFSFSIWNWNTLRFFMANSIPGQIPGMIPWAQGKDNFDPQKPLLNLNTFEPAEKFNYYWGDGPKSSNLRGFGYHNQDIGLTKNTLLREGINLQIRAEFFNAWNWHEFTMPGGDYGWNSSPFVTDIGSPDFGKWKNGCVSPPRNIQFGIKLQF